MKPMTELEAPTSTGVPLGDHSMSTPPSSPEKTNSRRVQDIALEVGEGAVGAVAGAALGAIAGPPGAIVGAFIGAAVGAMAGHAGSKEDHIEQDFDQVLDQEIGVTEGDIGEPSLRHPPTKSQEYAAAVQRASERPLPPPLAPPLPPQRAKRS